MGVALTVGRLRAAAQPLWLVCLFFVPFLNGPFLLLLCFLPPKSADPFNEAAPWPKVRPLDRFIPRGKVAAIALSTFVTTVIGVLFFELGTNLLGSYGWSLFVALPFCMGLFSVLLYGYHEPRSLGSCMEVSIMPIVLVGFVIVAIAVEGIICVLMAAPLALPLALLGGALGYYIQDRYWAPANKPALIAVIVLILPATFFGEHAAALHPPDFAVHSAVVINATPDKVWSQVIAFAENSSAPGIIISRRHRLSHTCGNFRLRSRRHSSLYFLHWPLRRAHHRVGSTSPVEIHRNAKSRSLERAQSLQTNPRSSFTRLFYFPRRPILIDCFTRRQNAFGRNYLVPT